LGINDAKKMQGWPVTKRLIGALVLLRAVEVFPFTSARLAFSPALHIQGTSWGLIYLHLT